ncbi:MAG: tRNA (adenosine(37)-N6)-dimethylallyltransferase MiaA [bacterium]|nr:tRNA (adenosine(37)-N6)-dimethylallyltransferase MiaA [bacterium]
MKYPLIYLMGPTGIGKTEVAVELAFQINAELISADSMQIYKGMEIGTSSPGPETLRGIPCYLINFVLPDRRFTAGDFKRLADRTIEKIRKKNKNIIIVGGTGLYFDTLIKGLPPKVTEDFEYRKELKKLVEQKGNQALFNILSEIDPEYSEKIHCNDLQRVIRALEVIKTTGKKFSEFQKESSGFKTPYEYIIIGLTTSRDEIYRRINLRTEEMLKNGWLDEVKHLKESGFEENLNSMKALGYFELFKFLNGEMEFEEAKEMIAQRTRNYAKRQLTWIRKYGSDVFWLERSFKIQEDVLNILKKIKSNGGIDERTAKSD